MGALLECVLWLNFNIGLILIILVNLQMLDVVVVVIGMVADRPIVSLWILVAIRKIIAPSLYDPLVIIV